MHWSCVVLILLTIQLINCDPLDKTENENRLKTCGKFMKSKVFQGRDAKQVEAPWSVFFFLKEKMTKNGTTCTGSIVSPRHVLISTHCFAELKDGETEWKIEGSFDRSKCQKDDYVITDENYLKRILIQSDQKNIALAPEKVTLVNACLKRKPVNTASENRTTPAPLYVDDFAIIDLYEELTFSESLQPVCVAESKDANAAGTNLNYFGYGLNPPRGVNSSKAPPESSGILRHETIQVNGRYSMEDYYFLANNQEGKTIACVGDSGGGAIADINGRKTVVGVLSQTNCELENKRGKGKAQEQYASVGYYSDHICDLTGICKATTDYERYHKGYIKKEKPVRNLKELSSPGQGGPGAQNGQEGAQIVIQNEPDSAFGIFFNWILVSIIFVLNF